MIPSLYQHSGHYNHGHFFVLTLKYDGMQAKKAKKRGVGPASNKVCRIVWGRPRWSAVASGARLRDAAFGWAAPGVIGRPGRGLKKRAEHEFMPGVMNTFPK
jgi:hypothetical protein